MIVKVFIGFILLIAIIYFIFYIKKQSDPNKTCSEKCSSCQLYNNENDSCSLKNNNH